MGKLRDEGGQALVEAIPTAMVVMVFVATFLLAAYVFFARAWIHYQSEQAIYCLAEGRFRCRSQLDAKLTQGLPWGHAEEIRLYRVHSEKKEFWKVRVRWALKGYTLQVSKELDVRRMIKSKALRW